jgi:RHS repeat-associated protein
VIRFNALHEEQKKKKPPTAKGGKTLGRRTYKKVRNKRTCWLWNGNVPLHEWTELQEEPHVDIVTWVFEESSFVPCARLTETSKESIVADYLGTPTQMYDDEGKKTWSAELDIYGRVRTFEGRSLKDCPFRFQGQYEDAETGLYYNRFRYYDPSTGNYLSQDPIGLEGGIRYYSFTKNINLYIDVFGLKHSAVWSHTRGGVRIDSGIVYSGSDTPPGRRLSFPEQLQTHTEQKILRNLDGKVKPGDTIIIKGTRPPCNPGKRGCQDAMEKFAKKHDVTIIYSDGKNKWTYKGH